VLRIRHDGAGQRVAVLAEDVAVVEIAADEVAVLVEELPDPVLVDGRVEDVEGARAAAAGDPGVDRAVRVGVGAFADRGAPDRLARLPRWRRRVERLRDWLAGDPAGRRHER